MRTILSRRDFLQFAGAAGAALALGPRLFFHTASAAEGGRRPVLVHVFQRGGMDGLSAVVPFTDGEYYRLRRGTAIAKPKKGDDASAIDLDGRFGLHPALSSFAEDFEAKRLAIVHAVGSPSATRSHFDAQDYMEGGVPDDKTVRSGWLNRYLAATPRDGDAMFRAVAAASTLPRSLKGDADALAIASLNAFQVPGGAFLGDAVGGMYRKGGEDVVHDSGRQAFEAVERLKEIDPGRFEPENGATYPNGGFGNQMKMIAQLVKADIGLEAAFATSGGWDTHLNQGGATGGFANRLRELSSGIHALSRDLGDRMKDVVVVTLTEFGRTAKENGTIGTDHGHASASFVLGGGVEGGKVYGEWPGLKKDQLWQKRDLAVTTDFRDVLCEVLAGHMGAKDLEAVFPGHERSPVGLF